MVAVREALTFPLRRIPRTSKLVAGTGALGVVLGAGLVPVPCPWLLITGLDCPFCGGSRAAGDLLRGEVVQALDHNAFAVVVVLPLVLVVLFAMAREEMGKARRHWPGGRLGTVLSFVLITVTVGWMVVRNLPLDPFTVLRA